MHCFCVTRTNFFFGARMTRDHDALREEYSRAAASRQALLAYCKFILLIVSLFNFMLDKHDVEVPALEEAELQRDSASKRQAISYYKTSKKSY